MHSTPLRPAPFLLPAALALSAVLSACGGGGADDQAHTLKAEAAAELPAAAATTLAAGPTKQAQGFRRPTAPVASSTVKQPSSVGWSSWTKNLKPTFSGPYNLIGDPSVVRDGSTLRMAYNCYDPMRHQGAVCEALSSDGLNWTDAPLNDGIAGRLIQSRAGEWDDTHETPLIIKRGTETLLYFSGYVNKGGFVNSFPAYVGLANSTDGLHFTRYGSEPVIKTTPGGYDNDAVFSPSIVEHDGQLVMIYTGHCWTNCPNGAGVFLLAATSIDGRSWTKLPKPILSKADVSIAKDGVAEADIVKGPDGYFYLFMTLLQGDAPHQIGVARSATPFGPWDINPTPILSGTAGEFDAKGVVAPTVLIEGGKVRMWFHGFGDSTIRIGYAEAPWPLRQP